MCCTLQREPSLEIFDDLDGIDDDPFALNSQGRDE